MKQLFLDCDGVLADFDLAAESVFKMHPRKFEDLNGQKEFWRVLHAVPDFYYRLQPMPNAFNLFNAVKQYEPIILTGVPQGDWAADQKLRWRDLWFPGVTMITTVSRNKRDHGQSGDVLVDDLLKYKHLWEAMGGTFIHYSEGDLPAVLDSIREAMRDDSNT